MKNAPRTWEEVPGAVRRGLESPFCKTAEGAPVLSTAADAMGWRAGDINAAWGGPRPVTNLLIGSALGAAGGWGVGRLAQEILPSRYFDPDKVKRRAVLMGAAVGGLPAVWQAHDNIRQTGDLGSVLEPWPQQKAAGEAWTKGSQDLFDPTIHRDQFNAAIWRDQNTPPQIQGAASGLVEAASMVRGGSDFVSPFDVARIAIGAGAGLVSGVIAGKALGLLAGLTPEGQDKIQQVGLWSGILQSVIPKALGLR